MNAPHVNHPTAADLAAFAVGKLCEDGARAVAEHLEACPECRRAAEGAPADSFIARVKAAGPPGPSDNTALPGAPRPAAAPPDLPSELANHPRYRILKELGRGGMGVVYLAQQTVMKRQVVIKVINKALLDQPGAVERFRREVEAAAQLSHPNIVSAYDAEQAGELHMLVMEFVPGQSLAEVLRRKGPLAVAHACHFARQVALGLQHAHEQGMVHRDIKPQNLMVTPKGQVKVLDFGLAKVASESGAGKGLTSTGAYMGTPDYSAPEQATDARSADVRADLYSLGCTLYCLLAGRPPFEEDTAVKTILAHLEREPTPLPQLRPDVPGALWQVVARLLAKDPARRYQKPAEVAQALAPFVKPGTKSPAEGVAASAPGVASGGTVTAADTSKIEAVPRDAPGKAPAKKASAKDEAATAFKGPGEAAAPPKKAKPAREAARPARKKWWIGGAAAACLLPLLVLGGLWAAGVFKVKTADGILVVQVNEPNAEVFVDGDRVTVSWSDGGKTAEIHVKPGTRKVEVKKGGFIAESKELTFKDDGGREIFTATLRPEQTAKAAAPPQKSPPLDDTWLKRVGDMPADKQVDAVIAELKERNPGFDGKQTHKVEDGMVTELQFLTDHVTDLSPVRALTGLRTLQCRGSKEGKGQLADLSPLKDMELVSLDCAYTKVSDLSPLTGMPLTHLEFWFTPVSDLSPLKGMPLTHLVFWATPVLDLSPLKGMPLTHLHCGGTRVWDLSPLKGMQLTSLICGSTRVWDLSPLKDMKLMDLDCWSTPVSDLSPLKGMQLASLNCGSTRVSDLSPLKGMQLTYLACHVTGVSDLSPLKGMSLKEVWCDFQPGRDAEILRSIKTLERINGKPAAQFWKEVGGRETSGGLPTNDAWLTEVAALPVNKQADAVAAKLKELNPGFDGKIEYKVEGGQVVSLEFAIDSVKDISPVRALPGLRKLSCKGSWFRKGQLADLTPLTGMKLTVLNCFHTQVADLSPLQGMPLTYLDCGYTRVGDLTPLKDMKLTYLSCRDTPVSDLSPLEGMPLTELHCCFTQVRDLSPLKDMKLTVLNCPGDTATDAGLMPLQGMSSLRQLYIVNTKLTGAGLVHLKRLTDLELLNCAGTKLTGAELVHIEGMSRLEILHLDNTEVTDEGVVHLKGLHGLRELYLYHTRVTDAGLEHLAGLKNLAQLNLDGTAVTDKGVAKLKAALPKCIIIR